MQEISRYGVGLDVGSSFIRCVIGHIDSTSASPTIIGACEGPSAGMRKGVVVNLVQTAEAIDKVLEAAERMSGHQVHGATISVNGSHVMGMSSRGVIAVGVAGHEINDGDLARVEEAATVVQLPPNRDILDISPRSYQLDGQENIKDPIGMTGVRLEVDAYVITALTPHLKNLQKATELGQTVTRGVVPSGLAAARAVLSTAHMENGVALVDIGGSTTTVAVFEEGDLQHIGVVPLGGINITNDIAIGLKTDLDIAEALKIEHAQAGGEGRRKTADGEVKVMIGSETHMAKVSELDMIVDARLEEIFEHVNNELRSIGKAAKLPGGVVLTGGSAQLKYIDDYAKTALGLAARIGKPTGFSGVVEHACSPSYAAALGLMLTDLRQAQNAPGKSGFSSSGNKLKTTLSDTLTGVMQRFR